MSEEEIKKLLKQNLELSRLIYESIEKQRVYKKWTVIITIVVVVLPLIAIIIALPWLMSTFQSYYGGVLNL